MRPRFVPPRRLAVLIALLLVIGAVEAYRGVQFYGNVSAGRDELVSIENDLDLSHLGDSEVDVLAKQERLRSASKHLGHARGFVDSDPLIALGQHLPWAGKQVRGLKTLVVAADVSAQTGLDASEVALAFARQQDDPNLTSIQEAILFLKSQEQPMARVAEGLSRLQQARAELPQGLIGPLSRAGDDLDRAVDKLQGLVEGYQHADSLLPELLGFNGQRSYLLLPQNDTELFPSGGLISSYGIAGFEQGRLVSMNLEYFGVLFDRWQTSTREYVAPPAPLKNYLKHDLSWGLGEAGWYPDFPTTAELARGFVQKGGAPATDGTIAIDLKFIAGLLQTLGPVRVPEYDATVTAANVDELTLELTRDEAYVPGSQKKAFLSYLARAVLDQVYAMPKQRWVELLRLFDQMGRERHLQLNFAGPGLQELSAAYGFDGAIQHPAGDFLMITDTSVNSTKLNLILQTRATLELQLQASGGVRSQLTYQVSNPFPQWRQGKDARLVQQLMLDGVYGCYLRVYASPGARLRDLQLDGRSAGAEQIEEELGKQVFGRFFPVLPGATNNARLLYETPAVAVRGDDGLYRYSLYIQKQAGTGALPLSIRASLPPGASLRSIKLDGRAIEAGTISTDLRTDRVLEIVYKLP